MDAAGAPAGFRVGSVQVVPGAVCGLVSNGVLQSGLGVVPSAAGTYYHIWVANRTTNAVLRDYGMTPITGSSWTLDTYDTNMAVLPVSSITMGTVTTLAPGTGAACTISGSSPYLLNCGIPQGSIGATGPMGGAANIATGTTHQLPQYTATNTVGPSNITVDATGNDLNVPGAFSAAAYMLGSTPSLNGIVDVADPNGTGTHCTQTYGSGLLQSSSCSYKPFEWVEEGGQSLATGSYGVPALSTTQPYNNLMLSPSVSYGALPLIPLVEGGATFDGQSNVETTSSGMANYLAAANAGTRFGVGLHGYAGALYSALAPGTANYIRGTTQVQNAHLGANQLGYSFKAIGETWTHGESNYWPAGDCAVTSATDPHSVYEGDLEAYQRALQVSVSAIDPRTGVYPLFVSQMNSGWTGECAQAQIQACLDNPGLIICAAPKYQLAYHTGNLHLNNTEYQKLGEYYGKAIQATRTSGAWSPLYMTGVTLAGNAVTVNFNVPVAPLVIDTTTLYAHANYGFEYTDATSSRTISSVTLSSPHVTVNLSGAPGANAWLRYAWTCPNGTTAGNWCGATSPASSAAANYVGGNVRDSDSTVSPSIIGSGTHLYNWLFAGQVPIPSVPAPPVVSATVGGGNTATVAFNVLNTSGYPITIVTATSTPGSYTASGTTSPLIVSGLPNNSYTFNVTSTNSYGTSSAATTNSITVTAPVLMAQWNMAGDYTDASGNGYTGTAAGSGNTFVTDPSSGAPHGTVLSLNGSGYVTTTLARPTSWSWAGWVYVSGAATTYTLYGGNATGSNSPFLNTSSISSCPGGIMQLQAGSSVAFNACANPNVFPINQWVFVAETYTASTGTITLYQGGTVVGTGTKTGFVNGDNITLGALLTTNKLVGYLGKTYFYQNVISAAQVAALAAIN